MKNKEGIIYVWTLRLSKNRVTEGFIPVAHNQKIITASYSGDIFPGSNLL